ncbi:MAG: hypothetical protein K6F34_10750 [Lachnospiraceae bacterium]|nr:hypothetical protein [Lachnospiraceae bacterium]
MKRRLFFLFALLAVMSLALAGCKGSGSGEKDVEAGSDNDRDEKEASGKDNAGKKRKPVPDDIEDVREESKGETVDNSEAESAYMRMLSDEEPAVSGVDVKGIFRKGNRYDFSEIIDAYIKEQLSYIPDEECGLCDAHYSYIDCGNDGSEELAVRLAYRVPYGEEYRVCFFGCTDGEVKLLGMDEWGYRSELSLNKCGYVISGGSGGAALYVCDHYFYNSDNERVFLYHMDEEMGLAKPMISKYYLKNGYERTDYPEKEYSASDDCYYSYTYSFKEYDPYEELDSDEMYEKYYKDYMYAFTDYRDEPASPSPEMIDFYKNEGVNWYDYDEMQARIEKHLQMLGADDDIINAPPVEWESIVDLGIMKHELFEEQPKEDEPKYFTILDNHPKPYLSDNAPSGHSYVPVSLKQVSCTQNDITDVEEWFSRAGTTVPGNAFGDGVYEYRLTGDMGYGTMTQINVYNKADMKYLYNFDFGDFFKEDGYEENSYVGRGIHDCFIVDDMLYLNLYHSTYAADCPENAYMICVNINSGEVMCISDPLVANSVTFLRKGDNIITGYGFTNEDDYIYILNRYTGKVSSKIKVKKSPDYFRFVDDEIWVRTYSYDYVFRVAE